MQKIILFWTPMVKGIDTLFSGYNDIVENAENTISLIPVKKDEKWRGLMVSITITGAISAWERNGYGKTFQVG